MKDGFIRCGASNLEITLGNPKKNAEAVIKELERCGTLGIKLLVFPELTLTGYSMGDLFFSETLLTKAMDALREILEKTALIDTVFAVGFPFLRNSKLYSCAAVCHKGQLLGVVPKTKLSDDQIRIFTPWQENKYTVMYDFLSDYEGCTSGVPFSSSIVFGNTGIKEYKFAVEIGDTYLHQYPISAHHCEAGAEIILNLSSDKETVGNREKRKNLISSHTQRLICGFVCANTCLGQSVQDSVFSDHCIVCENGNVLAESKMFDDDSLTYSEIDIKALSVLRAKSRLYSESSQLAFDQKGYLECEFEQEIISSDLSRYIPKNPFLDKITVSDITNIQVNALCHRIKHINAKTVVIGISGGLDSTLALLVLVDAMDKLGRDRTDIIAVTMPCFGTTERTKSNAENMCNLLGVTLKTINIFTSVNQHFADIGQDSSKRDAAYENAQARERTQILMDIANMTGGFVLGTGDLSELALGWCTYNGDHMSMYAVNSDIPKTAVRKAVGYYAENAKEKELSCILYDIVNTPVSPELLPPENGEIAQVTEDIVGPYELHDFFIYYTLKYGFSKSKTVRLAKKVFEDAYDISTIEKWYDKFISRFFSQQFKRSCMPDGPQVFDVALSPRTSWVMPTDADGKEFLK